MDGMRVSQLAQRAGTSADTVRYYDRIGLLGDVERTDAGYRLFDDRHLRRLSFIRSAQRVGMSLEDVRELLDVRDRGLCPCGHTRRTLERRLEELEDEIVTLEGLRDDIRGLLRERSARDPVADDACWSCGPQLLAIQPRGEVDR